MPPFARYAWAVLGYNLGVVLWGAYVRASGSGAGCGSHWPLCNGEVLPRAPRIETLIELTHRLTSGAALVLVVGLVLWSRRATPRGHPARFGALVSLGFMIAEALLGAGLVWFKLVAENASLFRAFSLGAHLLNTFLLLAAVALTAWWASGGAAVRLRGTGASAWSLGLALLGVLLAGVTGAVTALGDTLFPATSLAEGLRQDVSPTAHLLVRLRVLHPALAIAAGLGVIAAVTAAARGGSAGTRTLARTAGGLVVAQWAAGAMNVLLLAPVWLQLLHLLLADLLWISLVLLTAAALSSPAPAHAAAAEPWAPEPAELAP
ncbi:MAG TPA: COX15/CtaA family protein [Gemmatimonadales bacterium]|nr:COX15/CtaA family protein [Gemmatimonadales bacterium]